MGQIIIYDQIGIFCCCDCGGLFENASYALSGPSKLHSFLQVPQLIYKHQMGSVDLKAESAGALGGGQNLSSHLEL